MRNKVKGFLAAFQPFEGTQGGVNAVGALSLRTPRISGERRFKAHERDAEARVRRPPLLVAALLSAIAPRLTR